MTDFILPTRTDLNDYEIELELDGSSYLFRFEWNYRSEYWFLTISDSDQNIVISSQKIVIMTPLLRHVPISTKPPGELIAIDTGGNNEEAGLEDLGERVLLMYGEAT